MHAVHKVTTENVHFFPGRSEHLLPPLSFLQIAPRCFRDAFSDYTLRSRSEYSNLLSREHISVPNSNGKFYFIKLVLRLCLYACMYVHTLSSGKMFFL